MRSVRVSPSPGFGLKSKHSTEAPRRAAAAPGPATASTEVSDVARPGRAAWRARPAGVRLGLAIGLLLSLALLLAHAAEYAFLTDDAYISFRYARNLANGHGLVFNPGYERVEGYTNFLFVLVLAAFQRLGVVPEVMAHVLTFAATVALWGSVAWFALRRLPPPGCEWLALAPLFLLAATRSIAVWSTSGLETRWFEALLVGGALRLAVEVEATLAGRRSRPAAAWLFALAALTRPDGLLLAACAFGMAAVHLLAKGRLVVRRFALRLAPFVVLVGGHFAWRHAYYGYWLPNTYYAKVGGESWWSAGLSYGVAFALEYALYAWIPFVALGALRRFRLGQGFVPLLFGALLLPHAGFVAAVGGDHFEYRPLDLYFPFLYLLLADGLVELLHRRPRWTAAAVAATSLVAAGVWELPAQSRRQFPRDNLYGHGFPGLHMGLFEVRQWLDPARSWLYRWPGVSWIARAHRDRLVALSPHFVGLRQEEHAKFLASVLEDGRVLRDAVDRGLLPEDTYLAMLCVGAIPYYSDLRTLDILGLTDAHVAHSPSVGGDRVMAHVKGASLDYARSRGVDLWAVGSHPVLHATSREMRNVMLSLLTRLGRTQPLVAASLGDGWYLVGQLVQGEEGAVQRFPRLRFRSLRTPDFAGDYRREAIAGLRARVARDPADFRSGLDLAYMLVADSQSAAADALYRDLARAIPEDLGLWEDWLACQRKLGDEAGVIRSLERALAIAEAQGDLERVQRFRQRLARRIPVPTPPTD